jgi:hypothetical protein
MFKTLNVPLRSFFIPAVSPIENPDEPASGAGMTAPITVKEWRPL